jgi:hypothetical protein
MGSKKGKPKMLRAQRLDLVQAVLPFKYDPLGQKIKSDLKVSGSLICEFARCSEAMSWLTWSVWLAGGARAGGWEAGKLRGWLAGMLGESG